jgi:hypothetical protein
MTRTGLACSRKRLPGGYVINRQLDITGTPLRATLSQAMFGLYKYDVHSKMDLQKQGGEKKDRFIPGV